MYLSTSTSTEDFTEMYSSTFQVLYKLYLSTDVLKYKVLLPGSVSNMTFEIFPLAFRAGQFVDNSADNFTLQCRDYDTYRYTVTLTLGLWQQITSLRLVPKVITVTMIRVIHPHHNANRRWRASESNLRWKMTH